jgi:hypothetical protein
MSFFCRLTRKHYWCTPHRSADKRLVQVCYECGAERPVAGFQDDVAVERFNHSIASAKAEAAKLSSSRMVEESEQTSGSQERIAVGQGRVSKFLLIK